MASLISDAQKTALNAVLGDVHDTFARPIRAFKEGKQIVLSQNPGYSHIYKNASQSVTIEKVETTIQARIYYFARHQDKQPLQMTTEDYVKLAQAAALVRIKMKSTDADFFKTAERVILDESPFQVVSTQMPHGLFGAGFVTLFLTRVS